MPTTPMFMPPDWVLLGYRQSDGTRVVIGSATLTRAELIAHWESDRVSFASMLSDRPIGATLKVRMNEWVMAAGPTYNEAIITLFSYWAPDESEPAPPEIAPAPGELSAG